MAEESERIDIPLVWVGAEEAPILLVNQFLGQSEQEEIVLSIGQMTPPVLMGTREQIIEQARQVSYVPVRTVARLGLTRGRLQELMDVLQQTLANYDRAQQAREGGTER